MIAIENGNITLLRDTIIEFYGQIEKLKHISISDIREMNRDLLLLLEKFLDNVKEKKEFINEIYNLHEKVEHELNIETIKVFMIDFVESVSNFIYCKKEKKERGVIYEVKSYIEENYMSRITLKELSRKFFLSGDYISKMFKEEFGVNLLEHVMYLRISQAKQMLAGGMKIYEVADILGFTDESHFSNAFKKHLGMSPKIFKEKF